MKQNIRIETFETNSSSYHTLSIVNVKDTLEEHKEIIKGKDLIITSKVKRETFSYTSSYQYIAKSNYEKAHGIRSGCCHGAEPGCLRFFRFQHGQLRRGLYDRICRKHCFQCRGLQCQHHPEH